MGRSEEVEPMLVEGDHEVEVECPQCGARLKTTAAEARKGVVRCPNGHEIPLMGMLGVPVGATPSRPV